MCMAIPDPIPAPSIPHAKSAGFGSPPPVAARHADRSRIELYAAIRRDARSGMSGRELQCIHAVGWRQGVARRPRPGHRPSV